MNPDIQRIAENWTAKGGFFPNGRATEVIIEALKELSALRDTQERELREDKRRLDWLEQNAGQLAHCTWMNTNMGRLFTFRYGITLGDCEKTLRDAVDVELEQREGVIDPQEIGETKVAESDLEQRFLKLQEDYQSLRAELTRRDEVEKELREEKKALLEGLHNTENKLTDVTVELNGTKKAFKDYVEEMLNELRYRGKVSMEREKEWESELSSLRSRIGELESLVDKLVKE